MKFKRFALGLIVCITMAVTLCGFGGCSTTGTPQSDVYQIKSQYSMALDFALFYKSLPPCDTVPAATLCSNPVWLDKIKVAANDTNIAINAAEDTVRSPNFNPSTWATRELAVTKALTALLQIITSIETENPKIAAAAPLPKRKT
jgi:hypothetical protein